MADYLNTYKIKKIEIQYSLFGVLNASQAVVCVFKHDIRSRANPVAILDELGREGKIPLSLLSLAPPPRLRHSSEIFP